MRPEDSIVKRAKKVVDAGMNIPLAQLTESIHTNDKLDEILARDNHQINLPKEIETIFKAVTTLKGEKGDKGETGEKGDKGDTGSNGRDGKDGRNGIDGKDGLHGYNGVDGLNGIDGVDGKDGKDGKDGSPDTPEQIVVKINTLEGEIEPKAIKGLDKFIKATKQIGAAGSKLLSNLLDVSISTPSNGQVLTYDSTNSRWYNATPSGSASKRVVALTDAATVTPNGDTTDIGVLTSLSQTTTIANPSGTPVQQQQLEIMITSASSQTLSFGAIYSGSTAVPLPTATTGSGKTDHIGFRYNATSSKWECLATSFGYA